MELIENLEFVIILIFVASLVGIVVERLRMPYTVGLVTVGLGLTFLRPVFLELSPEFFESPIISQLILVLLVPPLIFEAAFHIKFDDLRRNLVLILAFAIPGVVLTMLMVGGVIAWGTGLELPVALVFGALIAATDPVAVVALFRSLGVPRRLQLLLEGESLFNDGTAIVIVNMMLAVVATGRFNLASSILEFLQVAGGGLVVGFTVATMTSLLIGRIDNDLLEVTLTGVAAYGSYLIAEELHLAGVLAVVAAGLVSGNIGPRGMSPSTRLSLFQFWEYAAFLANSFVFLVIGLAVNPEALVANWRAILLAIAAVLVTRAVVIYSFSRFIHDVSVRFQHVVYWGGLRGAISLALALSLPVAVVGENLGLLQAMAFGVVLFTILGQGSTMQSLIRRLGLTERTPSELTYERRQARAVAARSAYEHLKQLSREGMISQHTWEMLERPIQRQIEARTEAAQEVLRSDPSVEVAELTSAFREALRVQRTAFSELYSSGAINDETFSRLVSEVDSALLEEGPSYPSLLLARSREDAPITRMITAVIHQEDLEHVISLLNILGIPATQLNSTGGRGANMETLLIGTESEQLDEVVRTLCDACSTEPDFASGFLNEALPLGPSEEVEVDNMLVYVLEVEHYEEF